MDVAWGEASVVGNEGPVVVSSETLGFAVTAGSTNEDDVPLVSAGLDDVAFFVDPEVVSESETKGVVVCVVF